MFSFKKIVMIGVVALALLVESTVVMATTYRFRVTCPDKPLVVEWRTGDIDPGKEYLKVVTGTHYPGCQVSGYDPGSDSELPVEKHSHEGAVISGIPFVGRIIGTILGF